MQNLNHGRESHTSCSFQDGSVYVFCGRSTEKKNQINRFECLNLDPKNILGSLGTPWKDIKVNGLNECFDPRIGVGACDLQNGTDILLFGGMTGLKQFSRETFIFNAVTKNITRTSAQLPDKEIFPLDVPTVFDPLSGEVITTDFTTLKLYAYKDNSWRFVIQVK